jgi:hypothetical protein
LYCLNLIAKYSRTRAILCHTHEVAFRLKNTPLVTQDNLLVLADGDLDSNNDLNICALANFSFVHASIIMMLRLFSYVNHLPSFAISGDHTLAWGVPANLRGVEAVPALLRLPLGLARGADWRLDLSAGGGGNCRVGRSGR